MTGRIDMGWLNLDGRVALVTGAASGIGRATATALAAAGAGVVLADLERDGVAVLAGEIAAAGGAAWPHAFDVTDEEGWQSLGGWIGRERGRLDILVNSAGIVFRDRVGDATDTYRRTFAVNVEGSLLGMAMALGFMRAAGRGAIVNVSSAASLRGSSIMASYGASKAAIGHYTRSAAIETARAGHDIRVNSIHPGLVQTAMADDFYDIYGALGSAEAVVRAMTSGRAGRPEEIADLILFLVSDRASFISGAEIVADRAMSA